MWQVLLLVRKTGGNIINCLPTKLNCMLIIILLGYLHIAKFYLNINRVRRGTKA